MKNGKWIFLDSGLISYRESLKIQRELAEAKADGRIDSDVVFFVEHPPVFTIGKNGDEKNFLKSEEFFKNSGIETIRIERGGDITYHGEGQLVVYPVIDMKKNKIGVKEYVANLENAMIRTVADFGVKAYTKSSTRGIWTNNKKLGSLGIAVRRKIAFHGLALNVNLSLEPFTWINPCGLDNVEMTSIAKEIDNAEFTVVEVKEVFAKHFSDIFGIKSRLNSESHCLMSESRTKIL